MSGYLGRRAIFALQLLSISAMWAFVLGISYWIIHLLRLSHRLQDVPSASVGISIVAIPVFLTGAGVLTYVFFGLRRGARPEGDEDGEHDHPSAAAGLALLLAFVGAVDGRASELRLPDNPLQGRLLFESKHCHLCHGVAGDGPGIGPDLGGGRYGGTFLELGAALWNHVPGMSVSFEEAETEWPELSEEEAVELFTFLYFIDYLGRPGDAPSGRELFSARGCGACHVVGDFGDGSIGPDLSQLQRFASPIYIAQAIWNHGPSMFKTMREQRMAPPSFQPGDLADISAFLRQQDRSVPAQRVLVAPGNPNRGGRLFVAKGCALCHGEAARGGPGGPDLRRSRLHRSAEAIGGSMWNHAEAMDERRRQLGLEWPGLTTEELADLVAFLYFLPFDDPPGDPRRGAAVFSTRSCDQCHGDGEGPAAPPSLFDADKTRSAAAFVAAMWSHAPAMRETILGEGRAWPELSGQELRNLLAFLRARAGESGAPAGR